MSPDWEHKEYMQELARDHKRQAIKEHVFFWCWVAIIALVVYVLLLCLL